MTMKTLKLMSTIAFLALGACAQQGQVGGQTSTAIDPSDRIACASRGINTADPRWDGCIAARRTERESDQLETASRVITVNSDDLRPGLGLPNAGRYDQPALVRPLQR
jgi:starvation-inducible outer membrane lipoprotein